MPDKVLALLDRKAVLSMLWVFVVLNYLYADLIILIFRPGAYQGMAERMSAPVTLGATLLMEFLLAMAFLSRVLAYSFNRWTNIVAGVVGTAFVAITLGPTAPLAYWTPAAIEIACTLFIVWYAWTWRRDAPLPVSNAVPAQPSIVAA
jgi:hypothetical protein